MGKIKLYRFGESISVPRLKPQQVFEAHLNHLKKHKTLLFTVSSNISIKQTIDKFIFVNEDKTEYFEAKVHSFNKFPEKSPTGYIVPDDFVGKLQNEQNKGFKWFALYSDAVEVKTFKSGLFKLEKGGNDVYHSLSTRSARNPVRNVEKI